MNIDLIYAPNDQPCLLDMSKLEYKRGLAIVSAAGVPQ